MPKRSSKASDQERLPQDAAGESPEQPIAHEKDPAAVALGRRGGLKGGKARAAALTPERRREIAQNAVRKRWEKKNQGGGKPSP